MNDASVNIAPPPSAARSEPPLWLPWRARGATGSFDLVQDEEGRTIMRIDDYSGRLAWRSTPRKIEPRVEYALEAQVRGCGRLMLRWIRLERSGGQEQLGEIYSRQDYCPFWSRRVVPGVAPRDATHCIISLEAVGSGQSAEFRDMFIDGLGLTPLQVCYCQGGYHPLADKVAIVQLRAEHRGGRFTLIDADGAEVYVEQLVHIGAGEWGRTFFAADFTEITRQGSYALMIDAAGRRIRTKYFSIRADAYMRLANLALQWFRAQRCGADVPGWHTECHTDDGIIITAGRPEHRDAAGGWHDGGDYSKITRHTWIALHALTHLMEKTGDSAEGVADECRWGALYLLKIATDDGRFAGRVGRPGPTAPPEDETDRTPGTDDDRRIESPCGWTTASLASYSLANYARVIKKNQPDLARRCFDAARRTFAGLQQNRQPGDSVDRHAATALLCIALWRGDGLEEYRNECTWRIRAMLQQQSDNGIFAPAQPFKAFLAAPVGQRIDLPDMRNEAALIEYAPAPLLYLHALLCYLERSIDDALALEIRGALDTILPSIKACAAPSAFGQMGEWPLPGRFAPHTPQKEAPMPPAVNFPALPRGMNTYYLAIAYYMAKAAVLLSRNDLASLAQRQLEWVLGRNIRGTCMVCGVGHRDLGACYTPYAAIPAHQTGFTVGGVANGIVGGDGIEYPIDFPCLDIRASTPGTQCSGLDTDPRTNELWMPNCAWFILACGEITKMLEARPAQIDTD